MSVYPKGWVLGSYNSSLTAAYYQELLDLLNTAISSGDLSGGSAFDPSSLLKLEAQAQSFSTLPTGTAGVRVMDDSFNYPLSLLDARLEGSGCRSRQLHHGFWPPAGYPGQ